MSHFLSQYFSLRLKLFYRNFELGLLFWIIPIFIGAGITYALINLTDFFHSKQLQLLLANIALLIWIHYKRKDRDFLRSTLTKNQIRLIYYLEYTLLSSPLIVLAFGCKNWIHLSLFLAILGIPFLSPSSRRQSKPLRIFKKWNIEWNSGFRLYGLAPILVISIYISSFFLSTTIYLNLFLFGLTILSPSLFLSIEEAPNWIKIFDCSPQQFLTQKVKLHLIHLFVFSLLTTLPIIILEFSHWPLILLILAQAIFYNLNTTLGKYANYQNEAAKIITSIVKTIFTLVPFLLPLNIILSLFLYRKAIQSLKPYLHVNN